MNEYLNTIYSRLSKHNTMGMSFYRKELSSFYGKKDFFNALHEVGHNAYKRSNIRASAKEQHIADFGQTGEVSLVVFLWTVIKHSVVIVFLFSLKMA